MRSVGPAYGPPRIVVAIIVATVAAYFAEGFLLRVAPGALDVLVLVPEHVVRRGFVWELITHAFLHAPEDPLHLVFNMLFLWWFGQEIAQIFGTARFAALYFGGAVAGGVLYAGLGLLDAPTVPALGASAAVMAVLVLAAIYTPDRSILLFFIFPVPIRWMVIFYVLSDAYTLMTGIQTGTAVAAHLGGALYGYAFHRWETRTTTAGRPAPRRRVAEDSRPDPQDHRVDEILDKINREGIGSLTLEERKILEEASRRKGGGA